jgi:subtilisin family serine protease
VSHAILECLSDAVVRDLTNNLPTMIVIASSGQDPQDQVGIGGAIDQALAQGVPVILSAGNSVVAAQAGTFVPAMHGDKDGVITVGATAFNPDPPANPTLADLNPLYKNGNSDISGQVISLHAPGGGVDSGFGAASGTSFSCALVAGLAATYLSQHPAATPAEVEQALVMMSVRDTARNLNLARSACAFGAWLYRGGLGERASGPELDFEIDSDGDGDSDFWEFLGSSDPTDDGSRAKVPLDFTLNGKVATLSAWLPHPVVHQGSLLRDGCWSLPVMLEIGDDLEDWQRPPPDLITTGAVIGGLQELRFSIDLEAYSEDRCFLRFDFADPSP